MRYTVVIIPSPTRTRILVTHGCDELLRATLAPRSALRRERAAIEFLERLAQWLDAKLHVALCVDERAAGFCLALTDEVGVGMRSVFFDVGVHDPRARQRRGRRIRGIGDFTDLRQLYLRSLAPDEN